MKWFQKWFKAFVEKIENHPTPLRRYVLLFFAILAFRLSLEFFSNHRLFRIEDIIHIGLWFMFIVSAFLVQLLIFSNESPTKVIKLVIVSFSIALSAPIIDLLFSRGIGVKMAYLSINTWQDVLFSYFTLGGISLSRGATLGIRIEIILLLFASFNYIRIKTSSYLKASSGVFSIYTVLFFSGTFPFLINTLQLKLGLPYDSDQSAFILFLLIINCLTLGIILYKIYHSSILLLIKQLSWLRFILFLGLFLSGAVSAVINYPHNWQFTISTFFSFPLLAVCLCLLTLYYVYLNHSKSLFSFNKSNFFLILIVIVSWSLSPYVFFLCSVIWGLLFLLYEAPLYLHKVFLLKELLSGLALTAIVLLGFVYFKAPMVGFPMSFIIAFLICFIGIEMCYRLMQHFKPFAYWCSLLVGISICASLFLILQFSDFKIAVLGVIVHFFILILTRGKKDFKLWSYLLPLAAWIYLASYLII